MPKGTEQKLVVPVLRNAEQLTIRQIDNQRKAIVEKVANSSLTHDGLKGSTFTITNPGTLGIDFFSPIINLSQVAIFGICRIRELPAFLYGGVYDQSVVGLSLNCDHHINEGVPAARFPDTICQKVEKPDKTWL